MPDYNEPVHAPAPPAADWRAMLHDLEKRVELLSDALDEVKLAMRRLVLAEPWLEEALSTPAQAAPTYTLAAAAPPRAVEYNDEAREAVRRAVEEAKAQMAAGALQAEPHDLAAEPQSEAEPRTEQTQPESAVDDWQAAVEAYTAELQHQTAPPEPPSGWQDEAAPEAAEEAPQYAWDATPEQSYAEPDEAAPDVPAEPDEDQREAARRAVEQAKAEMGFATQSSAPSATPVDDAEAAREAVRLAVMQARNELAAAGSIAETPPEPVEVAPAYIVPPPHRPERVHPPTITIEDPESRVELARVYNLLKTLDLAANSSLLNYSSRQVSVQLAENQAPDGALVGEAVKDIFEREPEVQVDGLNVIVKLGIDNVRAA